MSKYKTTKKVIKESGDTIYSIGYCNLQYLLQCLAPFAYSTRAEGWACDYYQVSPTEIISTGYAPIGKNVPYDLQRKYEDKARALACNYASYETLKEQLDELIEQFLKEIK